MNCPWSSSAAFEHALDRITLGAPGSPLMNEEERRTVAYHEGGHALVALLLPNVDPVHRVTITPRGRSLGVTQFRPIDDRRTYRRDYLLDRMAVGLGGRAAEEVAGEEVTAGAQNDLQQRATHRACRHHGLACRRGSETREDQMAEKKSSHPLLMRGSYAGAIISISATG